MILMMVLVLVIFIIITNKMTLLMIKDCRVLHSTLSCVVALVVVVFVVVVAVAVRLFFVN